MDDRVAKLFAGHMGVSAVLANILIEKKLVSREEAICRLRQAHDAATECSGGIEVAQALAAMISYLDDRQERIEERQGGTASALSISRSAFVTRSRDEARKPPRLGLKDRDAPTVNALCDRFLAEHVAKKRPITQVDYRSIISMYIRPELSSVKVAAVSFGDVEALHQKVTRHAPYRANRCVAVLSKMMALAVGWGWRTDNPCRGVELNQKVRRTRYFTTAELDCLTAALAAYPDRDAADAIRLLLLTRARRLEALSMRWANLDLASGAWTKQKLLHRARLSTPARELLAGIRGRSPADAVFVFPGRGTVGHRRELQEAWRSISKAAGIVGAQLHDLRDSLALILASGEASPLIGDLLGHPRPSTTPNPRRSASKRGEMQERPSASDNSPSVLPTAPGPPRKARLPE